MATLSFNLDGNRLVLEFKPMPPGTMFTLGPTAEAVATIKAAGLFDDRLCSYASATLNGEPIDIARAEAMADEWRVENRRRRGETDPLPHTARCDYHLLAAGLTTFEHGELVWAADCP